MYISFNYFKSYKTCTYIYTTSYFIIVCSILYNTGYFNGVRWSRPSTISARVILARPKWSRPVISACPRWSRPVISARPRWSRPVISARVLSPMWACHNLTSPKRWWHGGRLMNAPSSQLTLCNVMLVHDYSMEEHFNLLWGYNTFQNYNCIAVSALTIDQRSRLYCIVRCYDRDNFVKHIMFLNV